MLTSARETWFPILVEGETTLDQVVGHRTAYAAAFREVEAALWEQDALDPKILELCRVRIAHMLGAEDELEMRTPAANFTEQELLCVGYAEQVLLDAQGVTDEQAAQVIETVGEAGFLVLTYGCGFFETTLRARLLLKAREQR